jgi:phospholipase C
VPAAADTVRREPCAGARGRYDLSWTIDGDPTFARRFAGHLENGAASLSQPY